MSGRNLLVISGAVALVFVAALATTRVHATTEPRPILTRVASLYNGALTSGSPDEHLSAELHDAICAEQAATADELASLQRMASIRTVYPMLDVRLGQLVGCFCSADPNGSKQLIQHGEEFVAACRPGGACQPSALAALAKDALDSVLSNSSVVCGSVCPATLASILNDMYGLFGPMALPGARLPTPPGDALFGCLCGGTIDTQQLVDIFFAPSIAAGRMVKPTTMGPGQQLSLVTSLLSFVASPGGLCGGSWCPKLLVDAAATNKLPPFVPSTCSAPRIASRLVASEAKAVIEGASAHEMFWAGFPDAASPGIGLPALAAASCGAAAVVGLLMGRHSRQWSASPML